MTRVLLAGLFHETHCFVETDTSVEDFQVERGSEICAHRGTTSQVAGFLQVADDLGWEVVPAVNYTATPSGLVDDEALAAFFRDLEIAVVSAGIVDAVFLSLHGAMVTRTCNDVEGRLLRWLRERPEFADVPIFGVFDLHANFSTAMSTLANGLVCYRENPHTDAYDTARRAATLLARCLEEKIVPSMHRVAPGIIWSPMDTASAEPPMAPLEQLARDTESQDDRIWAINIVAGFAYSDTPDTGVCISMISTLPDDEAAAVLGKFADLAVRLTPRGDRQGMTAADAVAKIQAAPRPAGPIMLVEPSDNIGAGAPGNGTSVLRALVDADAKDAAVALWDPETVAALRGVRPGTRATVSIGGRHNQFDPGPLELDVTLVSLSSGQFELDNPRSHLAASRGNIIQMGDSALVTHRGIIILLTSNRVPPFDLGQWKSQGVDPKSCHIVAVKAAVGHREAYDPISSASYTVETPGPCPSDPRALPYRQVTRPIYPLDA